MPISRLFFRLILLALLALALTLPCQAEESPTKEPTIPLYVAAGTNLIHLARDYCHDRNDWREIARVNGLSEPYLILHDSTLQVPLSLLVVEKLSATVASVHGPVERLDGNKPPVPINKGDVLLPGQTVRTGADGYTHLILPNNAYTRIEPDSQITLTSLLRLKDGAVKADLFLEKGQVIHWVREKLRANDSFHNRSPIAVTGIRGTEYRLKMAEATANTVETLRGRVEVSGSGQSTFLNPGQGLRVKEGQPPEQPRPLPDPPTAPKLESLYRSLPVVIAAPAHSKAKVIRLRITADEQAQVTLFDQSVAPNGKFAIGTLADGAYFASLTALDGDNFESTVTGPLPLSLRTTPATPMVSSPKTGATLWGRKATIEWLASDQVDHYALQMASDLDFKHLLEERQLTTTTYTSPELKPGTYHFRVKAVAPDGFNTLYSIPLAWKQAEAPKMEGVEGTANVRPTLQWPTMAEGWSYDLQVASDETFETLAVDQKNLTATSFTLEEQLPAGTYYVRIRGLENGQPVSPWTPAQIMKIKHKPAGWEELLIGVFTLGIILL